MRAAIVIMVGSILAITIGCNETPAELILTEKIEKLTEEKDHLAKEKNQLEVQLKRVESENQQLGNQVRTLSGLPANIRLENLYSLQDVRLTRYTNLYDKNNDGQKEKLIVYLKLIDEQGDFIKASGAVDVELWDLSKEPADALLGHWHVEPGELKKLWYYAIIGYNYRLTFDVADIVEKFEEPLTIKVTFADYITGKMFKLQKVIEP